MKFLIDAQLPKSICEFFAAYDVIHTSSLKNANQTKDTFINELSLKEKRAVITKDTDFYYSYVAAKKPYKLILVRLGNVKLKQLKEYFKHNSKKVIELLESNNFLILERNKIRILD
jgi:predicted nuclease of predicted toxin-antitoxin system